ncbi:hypothetical protein KEM52_006350 [Ascosphaera acerosa]|nr:hypothetical protein KEM52_006350 [Ascosphaera acerosa]
MFRSAVARSLLSARAATAATAAAPAARPALFRLAAPAARPTAVTALPLPRWYSAAAGLTKPEVQGRIFDVLKNFDKVACRGRTTESAITESAHFTKDLGLDSLDTVEVVMAIEEEFSIEIPDKDADAIHSVNQAVDYILSQPEAAGSTTPTVTNRPIYMSAAGGLTRRRGARGGGGGADDDDSADTSRVASPSSGAANGTAGHEAAAGTPAGPAGGAGGKGRQPETSWTNGENGHRIAFDPKDMSENEERRRLPKLTLMEEVLLLGLKDKQGYLSFWNENISYALRGCIVLELALRGRISMQAGSERKRYPLSERMIEVVDDTLTGEVLLDEALKMMKSSEKMSVTSWIDLMSGETWNLMKIGYQLKQVRERLAKGLVDKGILRTEKRNFLLFDMATHPVADTTAKDELNRRVRNMCSARTVILPDSPYLPETSEFRCLRTVSLVCAAYAANVLENALITMTHEARERAFSQVDDLLTEYSEWPFPKRPVSSQGIGLNIASMVAAEVEAAPEKELQLEVVAAVLSVFTRLDSLL